MTDILIVEDNKEISDLLYDFLTAENYTVSVANDGEKALSLYEKYGARLIVLDIMLPKKDGFEVCRRICENNNTPIIIISAKNTKSDIINGLMLGACDYIEKPFDIDILLVKIKGIFKQRYKSDIVKSGSLTINKINRTVFKNNEELQMTSKEYELLLYLVENSGKVVSKDMLFNRIWGFDSFSEQQTLTVHINRLREKIEDDPKSPKHILTVWGRGYRYESGVENESV